MKYILNIILIVFLSFSLNAQSKTYSDLIKLKEGHTVKGTIVEWVHNEYIIVELESGKTAKFPFSAIEMITQDQKEVKKKGKQEYQFKEKGLYNSASIDVNLTEQGGWGLSHTTGWQLNRYLGVGLGAGIHSYKFNEDRMIIPVFVEIRSFLLKQNTSPYLGFKGGYGFALTTENSNMTDAQGGLFLNPEVGYRIGAKDGANFTLGIGIKIQRAEYTYDFPWAEQTQVDTFQFERLVLRMGLTF